MSIANFCSREIVIISENAPIKEAAKLMKQHNIGAVIVVKNKDTDTTPQGIVTDRDIVVELLAEDVKPEQINVKDIITAEPLVLDKNQGVHEAIKAMKDKHVRRAPVVDEKGKVYGLISMDDLLVLLSHELHDLAQLVEGQVG